MGRIVRHVASDDEVSIEAEIPRRLVPRFHGRRAAHDGMTRMRRRDGGAGRVCLLVIAAACASKTVPRRRPSRRRNTPDYIFPAPPAGVGTPAAIERHQAGWGWLQAGDLRSAERNFNAALKQSPPFYPAEAGLGYVALAQKKHKESLVHFDRARRR